MPSDPIVVVAGHICVDIHVAVGGGIASGADLIAPGKLVEVGAAQVATGGPVPNTGLTLHRLGMPVRLVGKVGDDVLGRTTLDVLRGHGPQLADEMVISTGDQSSYTIVISPPGVDRSFLHFPGANHTFAATDIREDHLAGAAWLHFGYPPLMRSIFERNGAELVEIFRRARAAGLVTSLDMAVVDPNAPAGRIDWRSWLTNVLPHVDVFLPSLDEIVFMLDANGYGRTPGGTGDPSTRLPLADVAGRLLEMGASIVGLKLGDSGFYVRSQPSQSALGPLSQRATFEVRRWVDCNILQPCFEVEVCGTTGAGDATIAGFIAAMLKGLPPEEVGIMATAVGACSVEAPDASSGVPPWRDVATRVAAGWKTR